MNDKLSELLTLTSSTAPAREPADGLGVRTYAAVIDPIFTIGPKVHGGSLQMVVANAARQAFSEFPVDETSTAATVSDEETSESMVPVAISSDFLSAPDPAAIDVVVTLRKRGRTVAVMSADVVQNGRTVVASSVTFARLGAGTAHHSAPTLLTDTPPTPPSDGIFIAESPIAEVVHLGPAVDTVLDSATFPMVRGETGTPVIRGWSRPNGGDPDIDFVVLVADISPPVVMNLALFGWAPTVQLTTYIRRQPAPGWLRWASTSVEVGPGMFEEDHLVVDSTGAVVAQSRQLALLPQGPG